ncbi:MAG: pimeloyl-ACP methyl ester carboxylesterase [Gammaproteobacteria bacterium]|jgi:pimeloyl-ACP methyl ester carboxylesterase
MTQPTLDGILLSALPDIPDYRDRMYEPTLEQLCDTLPVPEDLAILNQGIEGACTGFGLAAVINGLHQSRGTDVNVSARMLYEMAKRYDEWPGEEYAGSSCRGAIKGWYHMGVCAQNLWPYVEGRPGDLTLERAKDARANTVGAYYRVRKNIVDMHAALMEARVIYVSADVHAGWTARNVRNGTITPNARAIGGHAFAIVGYDNEGFFVQNSWGPKWGNGGVAKWLYEDWQDNMSDAWVVQLALSTPQLYSRRPERVGNKSARADLSAFGPRRDEIAGHFAHIDDGKFHETGRYWSNFNDVKITADLVAKSDEYDHILLYAHGGLNSVKASATRTAALRDTFKRNRIYPYHFMYDTGLLEELKDVVVGKESAAEERAGGFTDWTDRLIERATRRPGRALWREMKAGAQTAFQKKTSPGTQVLQAFLKAFDREDAHPKKIHLVGHSTGAILHAHLVAALASLDRDLSISTVSLLAPAMTVDLFTKNFLQHLGTESFGIEALNVYNLIDSLELDDQVTSVYRKSLLYLVSQSFEESIPAPILGMQRYSRELERTHEALRFFYSNGVASSSDRTNSVTHGGFDNDPATMNDILKVVLGKRPKHPFTKEILDY